MATPTYTCPCCGYLVFEKMDSYDFCPICKWPDDRVQLRYVRSHGANYVSLIEAQKNFVRYGVSDLKRKSRARPPNETDRRDPNWRPIDELRDKFERPLRETGYARPWPKDLTEFYYWRR